MWRAWSGGATAPSPAPPRHNAPETAASPFDEMLGRMFETGRQTQEDYQRGIQSLFDWFQTGLDRKA